MAKGDKKEAKKKDPNAPKRGRSAYILFSSDKRKEVEGANPGISFTEVTVKLGAMWKSLTEGAQKKYKDLAAKDKERYEKEKAAYVAK